MEKYRLDECCEILDSQRIPITGADRVAGEYPYYGANGIQDYVAVTYLMMSQFFWLKMVVTLGQSQSPLRIEFLESAGSIIMHMF